MKRKFYFKAIIFILMFSGFFGFAACKNDGKDETNENDNTEVKPFSRDLNGYIFNFTVTSQHGDNMPELYPDVAFSQRGDKVLERYAEAEKAFNCTIDFNVIGSWDNYQTDLQAMNMIGEKYADLIDSHMFNMAKNWDLFYPLNELEKIDLSDKKWGPPNYRDMASFKGNIYGVAPYYWGLPYPANFLNTLFFVPRVIAEADLPNPQEAYEQKIWNWDKFEEYCDRLTTKGAEKEDDTYGFAETGTVLLIRTALMSNGVEPIYQDSDGLYKFGLDSPQALKVFDWLRRLINEKQVGYYAKEGWTKATQGLISGKFGFIADAGYRAFYEAADFLTSDLKEAHAWIPFPVGPDGKHGAPTTQFFNQFRVLAIPSILTEEELSITQDLMNYIFEPLDGEDENSWQKELRRNFFYDDLSFKYFLHMVETSRPDYSLVVPSSWDSFNSAYGQILTGKNSPLEAVQKIKGKIETEIDQYLNYTE